MPGSRSAPARSSRPTASMRPSSPIATCVSRSNLAPVQVSSASSTRLIRPRSAGATSASSTSPARRSSSAGMNSLARCATSMLPGPKSTHSEAGVLQPAGVGGEHHAVLVVLMHRLAQLAVNRRVGRGDHGRAQVHMLERERLRTQRVRDGLPHPARSSRRPPSRAAAGCRGPPRSGPAPRWLALPPAMVPTLSAANGTSGNCSWCGGRSASICRRAPTSATMARAAGSIALWPRWG